MEPQPYQPPRGSLVAPVRRRTSGPGFRKRSVPTQAERDAAASDPVAKSKAAGGAAALLLVGKTPAQAAEILSEIETWAASSEFADASAEDQADTRLILEPLRAMVGELVRDERDRPTST